MPRLPAKSIIIQWREPEAPSYWLLYLRRGGPLVPARIFWADHEPGNEENKRDRWPTAHLAGEIAGKWVDPREIWLRVLQRETEPNHWKVARPLIPKDGLTAEQEYFYLVSEMSWLKENDVTHPLAKPYKPVVLRDLQLPW
jgi:hypothetical protein